MPREYKAYLRLRALIFGTSVVLFLFCSFLILSSLPSAQEVLDRIVAVVGNQIILESELKAQLALYATQFGVDLKDDQKRNELEKELLEQMINDNLLLIQAQKDTTIEVTSKEVESAVEEQLKKVKSQFSSEEAFQDQLKAERLTENELKMALAKEGMTFSRYRQQIRDDLGKMRLVNWEIKSKIVVKEEDLKKAYQENLEEYTDPVEVKVQQVFLSVAPEAAEEQVAAIRKEAQSILERARRGEDFAQLARDYSRGPESREGGVLGFFKHKELMPELEEAAFKLPPGELSEPVRSKGGFHILRVLERKGGEPRPFAEVQNRVRDKILETEVERQFKEWMKALKAKAYIEVRL